MNTSVCEDCINKEICGAKQRAECEHYDVALTRSEVIRFLDELKAKNPGIVPGILGAVKRTYKINLAI
jgi:hypothetical protein